MTNEHEPHAATSTLIAPSALNAGLGVWNPIETVPVPAHTPVLFWRKDSGWFEGKYTSLDGELSDGELESSELTEEEIFEMGYWWYSVRGITALSDDETPTYWMMPTEPNTPNVELSGAASSRPTRTAG